MNGRTARLLHTSQMGVIVRATDTHAQILWDNDPDGPRTWQQLVDVSDSGITVMNIGD